MPNNNNILMIPWHKKVEFTTLLPKSYNEILTRHVFVEFPPSYILMDISTYIKIVSFIDNPYKMCIRWKDVFMVN